MAKEKLGLGSTLKLGRRNRKTDDPKAIDALVKQLNKEEQKEEPKGRVEVSEEPIKKVAKKPKATKKPPKPLFVSTSMKYPKELYKRMKVYCAHQDITIRDYLIKLVEKDLAKKG